MAVKFQLRRDTAANWTAANTVLDVGEPGFETDTRKLKMGDGATPWNSLDYTIIQDFSELSNIPTTLAGYGITDAATSAQGALADTALQSVAYDDLTTTPTTLSGYGITDAATSAQGALADTAVQPGDNIETSIIDSADSSAIQIQTDVEMLAGLTVGNHIIPSSNENIDLGSATNRFRELFLSGNTISLDSIKLSSTGTALLVHDGNNTRRNIESHNIDANDITANDITAAGDVDVTGNLTMTGYIAGPATFVIDPAAVGDDTGTLVIAGNLQVDGTTTTINSTTLEVEDKNVVLGPNAANDAANNGAGLTVTQPDTSDASLIYNTTDTQWELNKDLDVTGAVTADELTVSGTTELNGNTTVDGWLRIQGSTGSIFLTDTDVSAQSKIWQTGENLYIDNQSAIGGDTYFRTDNGKIRQIIRDNGDISWRNTAGTADGLHWDAADMRLGIGTLSPAYELDVVGVSDTSIRVRTTGTGSGDDSVLKMSVASPDASNYIQFGDNSDSDAGYIRYRHSDDRLLIAVNTAVALEIDSSGNVGIGTNNPGRKLTIGGGDNAKISFTGGGTQSLYFGDGAGADEYAGYIHYAHADDNMRFNTTGDFTFRGGNVTVEGTTKSEQYLLDAIDTTISDTAVDVFVYDTSKDSDGGAWRKRTQHTSWYNEALNTATRGSRREFPAVAVIVVQDSEDGAVVIYDGDDPDMPLWMKFNSGNMLPPNTSPPTSVSALNGDIMLGFGNDGTTRGCGVIKFVSDTAYWWRSTNATIAGNYTGGGIINRNSSGSYDGSQPTKIVSNTVNDVAMTVLPNAPIDAATGLPVPTIAVATDGGVGVIKDDGVLTNKSGSAYITIDTVGTDYYVTKSAGDDYSVLKWSDTETTINYTKGTYRFNGNPATGMYPFLYGNGGNVLGATNKLYHSTGTQGVTLWDIEGVTDRHSLQCNIGDTHNTGWMPGDIKLATLSDTDDTDVVGSELVTNGTFDSNTTGWSQAYVSVAPTTFSSVNGQLVARRGDQYRFAVQQLTVEVGKTYTVSVDSPTGDNLMVGKDSNSNQYGFIQTGAAGTGSVTFTATQTALYIMPHTYKNQTTDTIFDNISVRLAELDRSVNRNGLAIFGNITKDPVATGADLVGYSGFSASNNIQQPYNSDMDIGASDDVCVITWAKLKTGNSYIFDRTDDANTGARYFAYRRGGQDDKLVFFGLASSTAFTDAFVADWHQYTLLRRGGMIEIWVDGKLDATIDDTSDKTNTSAKLTIGNNYTTGNNNAASDLALFRFSVTAPSPEQIAKIYNDEKHLFQENAKATLYGSSDAVTALAYDDSTELLHVGTSAGRSVFQGLRRVDNTTDAVGAAISASNGLVAED